MEKMTKHNSRKGMRIACKLISSLFVLYAVTGFIVLPAVLKHYLPRVLTFAINRPVTIKYVRFNPFFLSITLGDFKISGANGEEFVSIERLYGNFQLSSIRHGGPVVKFIEIRKPDIHIVKKKDGSFNFSDMFKKKAEEPLGAASSRAKDNGPGLPLDLCRISIKDADISYLDKASSFSAVAAPLDMNFWNLTNAPDKKAGFDISGKTDHNESFIATGTLVPEPFAITGRIVLRRVDLSHYTPLYSKYADFIIKDGKVDLSASFTFPEKKSRYGNESLINNVLVRLSSFKLADLAGGKTIFSMPEFTISGLLLSLERKTVHINEMTTADAFINMERLSNGRLNFLRLSGKKTGSMVKNGKKDRDVVGNNAGSRALHGWAIDIDKISVKNYAFRFVDNVPAKPVFLDIKPININGISFSNRPGSSGDVFLSFKTGKGIFAARGEVSLFPLNADFDIKADDIGITPVCPYIFEKTGVSIVSGRLNVSGHVSVRSKIEGISGGFIGRSALSDISALDGSDGNEFVKWTGLAFSDMRVMFSPFSVSIGEILLQNPGLKIVRLPGGTLNPANVFNPPGVQSGSRGKAGAGYIAEKRLNPGKAPDRKSAMVPVNIKSIDVKNGIVMFSDRKIHPEFDCIVSEINLRVNNLLFSGAHKMDFALSGVFEDQAALSASGQLFPLDLNDDTRVDLDFSNIGMPVFSPYFGHYLGYELKKGKLFLKLGYKVEKNRMSGQNHVVFDRLYLGKRVKSPTAVNLPLKLALALLRDRNEKIILDVPVKGDLENPEFHFGRVIYNAFVKLISKISASPFAALGSMFQNADQLGFVFFAPGTDELVKSQEEKVKKLVFALHERPSLQLIINPVADPVMDGQALVDREFMRRSKSEKKLKSHVIVSDHEILELARKRGDAVRDAILEEKKIKPARVFLTSPRLGSKPMVEFRLETE